MDTETWVLIGFTLVVFIMILGAYLFANWRAKELKKIESSRWEH